MVIQYLARILDNIFIPLTVFIIGGLLIACGNDSGDIKSPRAPLPKLWGVPVLEDLNPADDIVEVNLEAGVAPRTFGSYTLNNAYSYNGINPGPVVQAFVGDTVIVHFTNNLPEPTTVHWHGLRVPSEMDGTPRVQNPVAANGGTFEYKFVVPEAATFWYHPHVRTSEQVERGLYGSFIVHERKPLPYAKERVLVLDDIYLDDNNDVPALGRGPGDGMGGRLGNILLTNGQPSGDVTAEAKKGQTERWRIVNTSNARTMYLSVDNATIRIIATDGGLLSIPVPAATIELPVGARYDVEVSFHNAGTVSLLSEVRTRDGQAKIPVFSMTIADSEETVTTIDWPEIAPPEVRVPNQTKTLEFTFGDTAAWGLNGHSNWVEPIFTFQEGDTVAMTVINRTGFEHPFHLHGQWFTVDDFAVPGLRDTVLLPPGSTTEITAYFDNPGEWMAHCHILEHAERGMMSAIKVTEN